MMPPAKIWPVPASRVQAPAHAVRAGARSASPTQSPIVKRYLFDTRYSNRHATQLDDRRPVHVPAKPALGLDHASRIFRPCEQSNEELGNTRVPAVDAG